MRTLLLLLLVAGISAKSLVKRNNAYGDELITPSPLTGTGGTGTPPAAASTGEAGTGGTGSTAGGSSTGGTAETGTGSTAGGTTAAATSGTQTPAEQQPASVKQKMPAAAPSRASGYRKKRSFQNQYGDEAKGASMGGSGPASAPQAEQQSASVMQKPNGRAAAMPSGY